MTFKRKRRWAFAANACSLLAKGEASVDRQLEKDENGLFRGKDGTTCLYCGSISKLVEAGGMWHCNNLLCEGPGAAWFRSTLPSYKEADRGRHTVDPEEWCREASAQLENRPGYVAFDACENEEEVPVTANHEVTALTQKDILNALIAKRQEKNMTRGDVAKALSKNFSVVRSLESCEHDVLLSSLLSYAKAIGCRVEFRVTDAEDK